MGFDDTIGAEAGEAGDFGEVVAVVHHVNRHRIARRQCVLGRSGIQCCDCGAGGAGGGAGVEDSQDGPGGCKHIDLPGQRALQQLCVDGEYGLE